VTFRKATITHEGRSPDDATLATVWIRGEMESGTRAKKSKRSSPPNRVRTSGPGAPGLLVAREDRPRRELSQPPTPEPAVELTAAQSALEQRLKLWRREEAGRAGLPSFFVFSDTVLRNIVVAGPTSLQQLSTVRGVGPEKLEKFGAAVLEMCRA
jgi:ATP-dependent DNA helicase RecQ